MRISSVVAVALSFLMAHRSFAETVSSRKYSVRVYQTDTLQSANPLPAPEAPGCNPNNSSAICPVPAVVYSQDVIDKPQVGEIFLVICELTLQEPSGGSVKTAAGIYLGRSSAYNSSQANDDRYRVTETNGENQKQTSGLEVSTYVKVGTLEIKQEVDFDDRRYMNVFAYRRANITVNVLASRLTVVRFTPLDLNLPGSGWKMWQPVDVTTGASSVTATSATSAQVVYTADLDPNQNDPIQTGDVIIVTSETQATYTTSNTTIQFNTQLRLTNSTSSTSTGSDTEIGKANGFSMRNDYRARKTAAKACAYEVTSGDAGKRYVKLVAWVGNLPSNDEVSLTEIDENTLLPVSTGKLSVLRLRKAGDGERPFAVTRYDLNSNYNPMELFCTAEYQPNAANGQIIFSQQLSNLNAVNGYPREVLIGLSELEATNQDDVLKKLGSRIIVANSATSNVAESGGGFLSDANVVDVHVDAAHHVISPKVGMKSVSVTGTHYVNRVFWCDYNPVSGHPELGGFSGNCSTGSCSNCTCPDDVQCDIVNRGYGRLSVLRLTPLAKNCNADCAPQPPNGPDGVVNIDDLTTVINAWGSTGLSIWGDVNDNGVVNIDDLIYVITSWGPCNTNVDDGDGESHRDGPSRASMDGMPDIPSLTQDCIDQCGDDYGCLTECLRTLGILP